MSKHTFVAVPETEQRVPVPSLTRRPDWQGALDRFFVAHQSTAFSYGAWDCCLFVCDAIREITGIDPAEWFRGRYSSRTEAFGLVREYTGGSPSVRRLVERVCAAHDMPACEPGMAHRGDVALVRRGKRDFSLGIVALNGYEVMIVTPAGLKRLPLSETVRCWRV